jgi:hypothetical protein
MFMNWYRNARKEEIGTSKHGNFQVTRRLDGQHLVWYRKPPNRAGKEWIWLTDSVGNERGFDGLDEAAEEATRQWEELLRQAQGGR